MDKKWYLSTWFISIMFALWFLVIPIIAGIALLALSINEDVKLKKQWKENGFGDVVALQDQKEKKEKEIKDLTMKKDELLTKLQVIEELDNIKNEIQKEEREHAAILNQKQKIQNEINQLDQIIYTKKEEIIVLDDEILYQEFGFYTPKYNLENSEQYKIKLNEIREKQKLMAKNKTATSHYDGWELNGSKKEGEKMNNENIKMTLYSFNTDCDNAISRAKFNNIESIEKRIIGSFDKMNKMNQKSRISIKKSYLDLKLEELYLAYEYEKMKEEEKEEQRRIKEEMKEEEKARKEIEAMKQKIEKEEKHFKQEINSLNARLKDATAQENEELLAKIKELENKLELVEKDKENVFNREQNTRAGYVYIISNIGSFGENVYKIGMTRRLEPMDRVKELGDASVPFTFDVHALIFAEDAPTLENALHKAFHHKRVNKVNERKEFFRVSLKEIEEEVKKNHNKVVEFTKLAEAEQYRESLMKEKHLNSNKELAKM